MFDNEESVRESLISIIKFKLGENQKGSTCLMAEFNLKKFQYNKENN